MIVWGSIYEMINDIRPGFSTIHLVYFSQSIVRLCFE